MVIPIFYGVRQQRCRFCDGYLEAGRSLDLGVYAGKARASLSHSKAPASDPSATLMASGGRYNGAGKDFVCCECRTGMSGPLKRAGIKDQRYMEKRSESEWASCGD